MSLPGPKGLIREPGIAQKTLWFLGDNVAAIVLLLGLLAPFSWYIWAWYKVGRDPGKRCHHPAFRAASLIVTGSLPLRQGHVVRP